MKQTKILLSLLAAFLTGCAGQKSAGPSDNDTLVIIHTNDTHSAIDPSPDNGLGGAVRRGVLIDSIRAEHANVLTVDAGDIVQGTLYFHLFKGEVEQMVLNELGYDIQIMGNHEFDNGMEYLRRMYAEATPMILSSNYDVGNSALRGLVHPWTVREYGGKKIGIMAINLDPEGIVAEGNYDGIAYLPGIETAQATADLLRREQGCDYVIAITHIGLSASKEKPELFGDAQLAAQTSGIDLIIGGHSHTRLEEPVVVTNADGKPVSIVQTGRGGEALGEVRLNLSTGEITYRLITVDSRLDSRRSEELMRKLEPYRAGVDSLYNIEVARLEGDVALGRKGSALINFAADFIAGRGKQLAGHVDGSIANRGGLRTTWLPGAISEGATIDMMPFRNKVAVIDIKGADLIEALDIMKARKDYAVSGIAATPSRINPARTYRIATIDYLANGGDYMTPLTRAKVVAESPDWAYDDLLRHFKTHPVIIPDTIQRLK